MAELVIRVSDDDVELLEQLVGEELHYYADTVEAVVEQLARAAADGIRRPGSWERGWIQQATGFDADPF